MGAFFLRSLSRLRQRSEGFQEDYNMPVLVWPTASQEQELESAKRTSVPSWFVDSSPGNLDLVGDGKLLQLQYTFSDADFVASVL